MNYKEIYPKAEALLEKQIQNENLRRHCRDVEKCMRFYATKLGEDVDKWGITGLLHDIDWETNPDTHPATAVPILEELGVEQDVITAILGHGYPSCSDTPRTTKLDYYLFACDELSGFVIAYSRMKPLDQITPDAVLKKLKDKSFASKINRDDITQGFEETGLAPQEHIINVIEALKG
jgi:putative nucleotidyltransferase with HDIG domain